MKIPKLICAILLIAGGMARIPAQRIAAPARTQSQGPRLIGSLTPAERNQLPASTQVKLPSGQLVTLGTLRAQHDAHMRSYAAAAQLGRALAEKLSRQSPVPGQNADKLSGSPFPNGTSRAGATRASVTQPPPHPVTQARKLTSRVLFLPPAGVAKDYLDFCNAAQATVCAYIPDGCEWYTSDIASGEMDCLDYMLTDADVCSYDGGRIRQGADIAGIACAFTYIFSQRKFFKPTGGPANLIASCAASSYQFDAKGAVQVDISGNLGPKSHASLGHASPGSCVVQVWLSKPS